MSTGLVLGLLASLAWGLVDISGALAARRVGSLRVLVGTQSASVVGLAAFIALRPGLLGPGALDGIVAGLPLGVFAAVAYLSYFTALRIGPISVVSPVIVAYGGLTVVLAVLIRGESLLPMQAAGALLATCGVVLAGIVFDGSLRGARLVGPGVVVAVITVVLFASLSIVLTPPIRTYGWLPIVVGSRIAHLGVSLVLLAVASRSGSPRLRPLTHPANPVTRAAIALLVVAGVCDIGGFGAYSVGLEIAPVWLVGLASSFGPVLVIVYAVGRMGERLRPSQVLGLALITGGIAVLALAG